MRAMTSIFDGEEISKRSFYSWNLPNPLDRIEKRFLFMLGVLINRLGVEEIIKNIVEGEEVLHFLPLSRVKRKQYKVLLFLLCGHQFLFMLTRNIFLHNGEGFFRYV